MLRGLEMAPGVVAAGVVQRLPLEGNSFVDVLARSDDTRPTEEQPLANYRLVNPGYPQAMGIAVRRGRMFAENERRRRLIVVSELTARTLWPGEDPIGKFVRGSAGELREVVGVAADARIVNIEESPGFVGYVPYWDYAERRTTLVVRSKMDPRAVVSAVTSAVRNVDPVLPLHNFRTMAEIVSEATARRRFQVALMAGFALIAMLLAGIGVYGVVASTVARRRAEIAVRIAVGAPVLRVFGMSFGYGLLPVAAGALFGVIPAIAAGRTMAALLYEVEPWDWQVLASALFIVLATAACACFVPALRAVRTPTTTLLRAQ